MRWYVINLTQFRRAIFLMGTFLMLSAVGIAQKTITGKVTEDSQEPLIGVNVVVKGTNNGATTDAIVLIFFLHQLCRIGNFNRKLLGNQHHTFDWRTRIFADTTDNDGFYTDRNPCKSAASVFQ